MSIPGSFSFSIGGFFGTTYRFELERDEISYLKLVCGELIAEARTRPSKEKWDWFRDQVDKLNIWSWPPDCYQQDRERRIEVLDGSSWSLTLEYPDQKIESKGGTYAYPADPPEAVFAEETKGGFFDFLQAINELASLPELCQQNPELIFRDAQEDEEEEIDEEE